ncbi:phage/plasmid primase, P4 family [Lacticaseibacillus paracasei]|uniref:DNA primase family protein n=1 Tax=Lacticaseibacillus paracasei TaxID=1597 RepID=UPI0033905404
MKHTDSLKEELNKSPEFTQLKVISKSTLEPFDVNKYPEPQDKTEKGIREYNKQLAAKLPNWLRVWFQSEQKDENDPKSVTIHRHIKVDFLAYGYHFMDKTRVESFPGLSEGAIYEPSKGTWRTFGKGEFTKTTESRTTKEMLKWGLYRESDITGARRFLQRISYNEEYGKRSPFDENPHPELVAFANGTYSILTNKMQESSADNYMLNAHEYAVDPDRDDCPETERLLAAMMGDAAITFEEFIGYMFYRSYRPFQAFLWLYGTGGEGKSTLIRRITNLIGRDNVSASKPADLANGDRRFETANLYGKEANIVADVGSDYLKSTAVIKSLTGGDYIAAEFKGIQNFKFMNYAKLLFSANEMPAFSDHSSGFADRVTVIKMINGDTRHTHWWDQFDDAKMDEETPRFAMKCMHMFAKALKSGGLTKPDSVVNASQEWLDANDHFKEFLDQYAEINLEDDRGEASTVVTAEYKRFCQDNNYMDRTTTQAITKKLDAYGVKKVSSRRGFDNDTGSTRRYIGLRLTGSLLNPRFN